MYQYLQLKVPATHHGHILLLAQRGVPHGQLVVLVLDPQQLVAVGVPLLSQLVVPWRANSISDYILLCVFHFLKFLSASFVPFVVWANRGEW